MNNNKIRVALLFFSLLFFATSNYARVKGIYLTQYTLENTALLNYLIKNAKNAGIDTFVVDLELLSKRYDRNIALLHQNKIDYVARIIMFPGGGSAQMIKNPTYWQRKYPLVKHAVELGAKQIQLDYIRYSSKNKPSAENAQNVLKIIQWYKSKLIDQKIPLQIDVFGITSFGESKYIGQNIKLFSQTVDAICPMVYPSHYVPFPEHFKRPYETVFDSLRHIKAQFETQQLPMKVYAYIELSNYHYPMSRAKTLEYITKQIKAVDAAGADGWYAWSPHNRYDNLFTVLTGNAQRIIDKAPPEKAVARNALSDRTDKRTSPQKTVDNQTSLEKTAESKRPTFINWLLRKF